MGFLDTIENMAGAASNSSGNTNAGVTGSLLQELEQHPGGLSGVIGQMRANGLGDHVQNWSTGQQSTATPEQVQQGLGEGMIARIAERAGVSPAVAQGAIAVALPVILHHATSGGQQPAPGPGGLGSMASAILGKFL